jgi:hypothetical protein
MQFKHEIFQVRQSASAEQQRCSTKFVRPQEARQNIGDEVTKIALQLDLRKRSKDRTRECFEWNETHFRGDPGSLRNGQEKIPSDCSCSRQCCPQHSVEKGSGLDVPVLRPVPCQSGSKFEGSNLRAFTLFSGLLRSFLNIASLSLEGASLIVSSVQLEIHALRCSTLSRQLSPIASLQGPHDSLFEPSTLGWEDN